MNIFRIIRWSLCLFALCCFGCAAVNVDVGQSVDWSSVSSVAYQPPADDPWQLTPAIQAELQKIGFTVLAADDPTADLLVQYFTKKGPDLNADGDMLTRLKSFHVQFVDPESNENLAVVDYFYADTMADPEEESVALAFAELAKNIQNGKSTTVPAATTAIEPPAAATPSPAAPPVVTAPIPAQPEADVVAPAQKTQPAQEVQPETSSAETVPATADSAPAEQPATATITPTTNKSDARKVVPRTESPWTPRFHSWGFENWGEEYPLDDY